jgi:hypothetical protein
LGRHNVTAAAALGELPDHDLSRFRVHPKQDGVRGLVDASDLAGRLLDAGVYREVRGRPNANDDTPGILADATERRPQKRESKPCP